MTGPCPPANGAKLTRSQCTSPGAGSPTVASLAVRVRLVPIDADRESELVNLIASYERLRAEVEGLLARLTQLLEEGSSHAQDRGGSPSRSGL